MKLRLRECKKVNSGYETQFVWLQDMMELLIISDWLLTPKCFWIAVAHLKPLCFIKAKRVAPH